MDWLSAFEGNWRLYREIEDARAGQELIFQGQARLISDGAGLTYIEDGRWTKSAWGGMSASRRLLWRLKGDKLAVLYADGRAFHSFTPSTDGVSESRHDCTPDRYDVTYRFDLPEIWEAEWRANGPAKDYISRTRYDRGAPET
jgi:hypothetical protein